MKLPVIELVSLCREYGFERVFIDAAHAPGTLTEKLDLPGIGADFFAANLHKWLFAPTAAAFLHIPDPDLRNSVHHPVVSHNFSTARSTEGGGGGLAGECRMVGTRDYSPMLAVPEAIAFWESIGGEVVAQRNRSLCLWAAHRLAEAWGGELGVPEDMVGSTCMVSLPASFAADEATGDWVRHSLRHKAGEILRFKPTHDYQYDIESIHIQRLVVSSNRLWVRLSAAIYNYETEFDVLRDAILALSQHARAGGTDQRRAWDAMRD